jgi:hypothetical protein
MRRSGVGKAQELEVAWVMRLRRVNDAVRLHRPRPPRCPTDNKLAAVRGPGGSKRLAMAACDLAPVA